MNWKQSLLSAGSILLAFLASQHHNLHMLLMTFGVGGAGMSFMTMYPTIRRFMLLLSLIMTGVTAWRLVTRRQPLRMRVVGGLSALASVGLIAWSVSQFGL